MMEQGLVLAQELTRNLGPGTACLIPIERMNVLSTLLLVGVVIPREEGRDVALNAVGSGARLEEGQAPSDNRVFLTRPEEEATLLPLKSGPRAVVSKEIEVGTMTSAAVLV